MLSCEPWALLRGCSGEEREFGGAWPQGTGLSTPPAQRTEFIHPSLGRVGSRGEDSLAQAAELPVWALLLAEGLGAGAGIRMRRSGEAAGQRYIEPYGEGRYSLEWDSW